MTRKAMNLWASESVIRSPSLDELGLGGGDDDVQEVVEGGVDDLSSPALC